jgi:hypothetical protein
MLAIGCFIPLVLGGAGGFAGAMIGGMRAGIYGAIAGLVVGSLLMLAMLWGWEKIRTPTE